MSYYNKKLLESSNSLNEFIIRSAFYGYLCNPTRKNNQREVNSIDISEEDLLKRIIAGSLNREAHKISKELFNYSLHGIKSFDIY